MRRDSSEWSSSTMAIEALCSSCELLCAWAMIGEREGIDDEAEQHRSRCTKLRSSLVPSQKMLESRAHAAHLSCLRSRARLSRVSAGTKSSERQQLAGEVGEAQTLGEGADADRQEVGHREKPCR